MTTPTPPTSPRRQRSGNVTVLTFSADVVRDAEDVIARELGRLTAGPGSHLLLDFANVTYVNSTELGTLIGLHRRVRAAGGRLTLFNVRADVAEVFRVTRLGTFLAICSQTDGLEDDLTPADGTRLVDVSAR